MRLIITCIVFLLFSHQIMAQNYIISGTVKSAETRETLIQASIKAGEKVAVTDFDGNYSIEVPAGKYQVTATYIGHKPLTQTIEITNANANLDFILDEDNVVMQEVNIVADVAKTRQTPVAFTTVPLEKIKEELSVQDMPMLLNSTPGVYATQQGGGDGDARITIRGFGQRNTATLIDGIPVNDMESGEVFWSNWSGLGKVTKSMQVQRGLGASKLALPSVGGTINVITQGIESKRKITLEQEVGGNSYLKTTLSGTTGRLKNGFGVTFVGSYKRTNGWVDNAWSKAFFYFVKLEKQFGNHLIGLAAVGAPQEHAQRSFKQRIAIFDKEFAADMGADTIGKTIAGVSGLFGGTAVTNGNITGNKGFTYNPHWGNLDRYTLSDNGDTIHNYEVVSERLNYYHKPQFTLKDFWNINSKLSWSNIAYLSIGNGGGVRNSGSSFSLNNPQEGIIDYDKIYKLNFNKDNVSNILRSLVNNHLWYGLLSTAELNPNDKWTISAGFDLRSYRGFHYVQVYDLLGGNNTIDTGTEYNFLVAPNSPINKNDKIDYNYDGFVKWGGLFGQAEYKTSRISAFLNLTTALSNYKRIDYFRPKDLVLEDTTLTQILAYSNRFGSNNTDTIYYKEYTHNGAKYTIDSPEARFSTVQKTLWGGTAKAGVNFNIDEYQNVFMNGGYLDKVPVINFVFSRTNTIYPNLKNEKIAALEAGYGYKVPNFSLNVNAYYTQWLNKPTIASVYTEPGSDDTEQRYIAGIKALHKGIELDFACNLIGKKLVLEGANSIGDWTWQTDASTVIVGGDGNDQLANQFSANGVHVGDAAQVQFSYSLRAEPFKNAYCKIKAAYFDKNFAEFSPETLTGNNADHESWQLPPYTTFDFFGGYKFKIKALKFNWGFAVLNLFNAHYISDASTRLGFGINDIEVFFAQGRQFSTNLEISF